MNNLQKLRKAVASPAATRLAAARCYSAKELDFGSNAREKMLEGLSYELKITLCACVNFLVEVWFKLIFIK